MAIAGAIFSVSKGIYSCPLSITGTRVCRRKIRVHTQVKLYTMFTETLVHKCSLTIAAS